MQGETERIVLSVAEPNTKAMDEARRYQMKLAKPPGSLGRLEELAIQLAGITGKVHNEIKKKMLLVFAADNGVAEEGVSSAPQSVTLSQAINLTRKKTGAAVLAECFGAGITVCDVGINAEVKDERIIDKKIAYGTANIAKGSAMTKEQAVRAVTVGLRLAEDTEADILGIGEMGIGNTTTASAVLAVLLGTDAEKVTGRGGGLEDYAFEKKKRVINEAIRINAPKKDDVIDVLSKVGGFDIAAMCGAFIGAALSGRPAVIDGFISAVAALCAVRICPEVKHYLIASHASCEVGYGLAVEALGLEPMLKLNMRLGEGSGCPLVFMLAEAACAVMNKMATFEEAGINDDYLENITKTQMFPASEAAGNISEFQRES